MPNAKPKSLGQFIQAQRALLSPAEVGLPAGMRRRTPGLRREEVAQLCGISVTWYTWIEQGRTASISPDVLTRISEVLRLSRAKHAYLFELANKKTPDRKAAPAEDVPQAILDIVRGMKTPAYLLDRYWNAVAWNRSAKTLFAGWLDRQDTPKNLLYFMFCDPAAQALVEQWEHRALRLVAEFRADSSAIQDEPEIKALIAQLSAGSGVFKRAWARQDVIDREGGERKFNHPLKGPLSYRQVTFRVANRTDLKLVVLT